MGAFGVYILKSAIYLIVFFLLFKVLLSKDTFFRFNRFILLGGMLACCLLPALRPEVGGKAAMLCDKVKGVEEIIAGGYLPEPGKQEVLSLPGELQPARQGVAVPTAAPEGYLSVAAKEGKEETAVSAGLLWFVLYALGALGVAAGLGVAFIRMAWLLRSGSRQKWGRYVLVLTREKVCPFSWGRYIVMNENDYRGAPQEILAHEKVHAEKRHTWDLCFTELLLILQWFNPAIWLLKKELQEVHEYEADNGVINQGIDATKYQLLLVKKAVGARLYSIANSFDHSKLKDRITMMLKEKSNRWARLKVMLLLPPAALLMLAFARPEGRLNSAESLRALEMQGEETSVWTEDYYRKELLKHGIPDREINREEMHRQYGNRWIEMLSGSRSDVFINFKRYSIEQVKPWLIERLKETQPGKPLFITVQNMSWEDQARYTELLKQIGEAYTEVRAGETKTAGESPDLDERFPILVKPVVATRPFQGEMVRHPRKENKTHYFSGIEGFKKLLTKYYTKQDTVMVPISFHCKDAGRAARWLDENGWDQVRLAFMVSREREDWPYIALRWEGKNGAAEHMEAWDIAELEQLLRTEEGYKKAPRVALKIRRQKDDVFKEAAVKKLKEYGVTDIRISTEP